MQVGFIKKKVLDRESQAFKIERNDGCGEGEATGQGRIV
jgi:hypothetical protein